MSSIGAGNPLPMDQGLLDALEKAIEAFADAHDSAYLSLCDACPDGYAVESEPEPTTMDFSTAQGLVVDIDKGPAAEARVAFAIHRFTRDPRKRARELEDLACRAFARETLAGNRNAKRYLGWLRPDHDADRMHACAVELARQRGLISEALELMRRFFVRPESVPRLADDVVDALSNAACPPAQREGIFRLARFLVPNAIDEAYRAASLPPEPLPATWQDYTAHPLGRELLCLSVPLGQIEQALLHDDDSRAAVAIKVLQDLVRLQPEVAGAAEPWLRDRLCDERPLPRGGAMATVAEPLYRAALAALPNKRVRELLPAAVERSLAAFDRLSPSFWNYYEDARRIHVRKSTVLKELLDLLGDPDISPRTRVRAREILDRGPADRAVTDARHRADEIVLEILRDPDEPPELREAMRRRLPRWMPNRIAELRGNLIERVDRIPPLRNLQSTHGAKLDARLRELSTQVELDEIVRLTADGTDAERDRIETALALIPHLVSWREDTARILEPGVRARLQDPTWPHMTRAVEIYARLLFDIAESGTGMPDVNDVLAAVSSIPPTAVDRGGWCDLFDRLREVYAADRVPSWLTVQATDPDSTADVRFAAFRALCRRTELSAELVVGIGISAVSAETSPVERTRLVGLLCQAHPQDAVARIEQDSLPPIALPAITWLYQVRRDGTTEPRPGRHPIAARLVSAEDIVDAVRAPDRLGQTLAALELLPAVLESAPQLRADAIDALYLRIADPRHLSSATSDRQWSVMPQALDRYLDLVGGDESRVERGLLATLEHVETAQYAIRCLRPDVRAHWTSMIGSLFDSAVGHRDAPQQRLAAWVALSYGGASDHEAASQLATAATRVTPAIRALLVEPDTPAEVIALAREHPRARELLPAVPIERSG